MSSHSSKMNPFHLQREDPEYQYLRPRHTTNYSSECGLSYIEILPGQNPSPELIEGKLDYTCLESWLQKPYALAISNPPTSSQQIQLGGLRLLYGVISFHSETGPVLPLEPKTFALLDQSFGFPEEFQKALRDKGPRAFKRTSKAQDGTNRTCFVFKFGLLKPSYFQLALSYNHETRQTHGLLLSKPPDNHIKELIENLKSIHLSTSQPLLCATLMAEFAIDTYGQQIETCETEVRRLEQVMGQHEWDNIPIGNPLELDYIATTRRLNFLVRTLAVESMRLEGTLLTLECLAIYAKDITSGDMGSTERDSGTNKTRQIKTHEGSNAIEEKVAYLQNACQVNMVRAGWHTKRVQALIQVAYQFMAHQNANVNIAVAQDTAVVAQASKEDSAVMRVIAVESKKDSTVMKTIAVLGMLFLPGTFVAAIFAMPVFNWDGNGGPISNVGLKYYVAVALPLTCAVLVLWGLAMVLPWRRRLRKLQPGDGKPELSNV